MNDNTRWQICLQCMEEREKEHSMSAYKVAHCICREVRDGHPWQNPFTLRGATLVNTKDVNPNEPCGACAYKLELIVLKQTL